MKTEHELYEVLIDGDFWYSPSRYIVSALNEKEAVQTCVNKIAEIPVDKISFELKQVEKSDIYFGHISHDNIKDNLSVQKIVMIDSVCCIL